jgi:transposase
MAQPLDIHLSEAQRGELETGRDRHSKAYIRERCAAILKIAGGQSGRTVALNGLHKARQPDTVYAWVRRYQAAGLAGLEIRSGRGRKPAFSPSLRD